MSTRWRPKRASDRLLSPGVTSVLESPPQKKRTAHSGKFKTFIKINLNFKKFIF